MRSTRVVAAMMGLHGVAAAQEAAPSEPAISIGGSATVWLPQGDADEFADTSIGIRPHFAYRLKPFLAIVASIDFVFVNEKEGVGDVTYYSIAGGARLIHARPGQLEPYGELLLGHHQLEGEGVDDGGIGFRIGGGATYPLGTLVANFGLGYSAVSIDAGFVDVDVDALVLEIGLGARF